MELPAVLHREVTGDSARAELDIRSDLGWFTGHFPGHPILPGVVQIAWVVHFSGEIFGYGPNVSVVEQLKFKRPIGPGREISLLLTRRPADRAVSFEYRDARASFSSGSLRFKSSA
ncbi:MAG: hypothetical protein WBR15_03990 [Gammaproteobacteria bacterium]